MITPKIPIEEFITGEKFEALCDIDCEKDPNFERTIRTSQKSVLTLFTQTHELKNRLPILRKFPDKQFIVVSHNSDGALEYSTSGRWFDYQWQNEDNVIHWFSQNVDIEEPNVTPIPIGHENEPIFAQKTSVVKHIPLIKLVDADIPKENKMFLCFRTGTCPQQREGAYQMFDGLKWTTCAHGENGAQYVKDYFDGMIKHKFILCPDGNGIDTVRMWEALYMGCIPIVRRHAFAEFFARYLPIIIVDSFKEISPEMLEQNVQDFEQRYFNYEMLTMSYWAKKIAMVKEGCL